MLFAAHVHHNRIDRIGTLAIAVSQTPSNIVQAAKLWLRPENTVVVSEFQGSSGTSYSKLWIKLRIGPGCLLAACRHALVLFVPDILHQYWYAALFNDARTETAGACDLVVVTCIAGPARDKSKRIVPRVNDPMRNVGSDVVKAALGHVFIPSVSRTVSEQQFPTA